MEIKNLEHIKINKFGRIRERSLIMFAMEKTLGSLSFQSCRNLV